jgi:FkbM family methyltransferase
MKSWLKYTVSSLAAKVVVRGGFDMLDLYYKHNGILQYKDSVSSGEDFFISKVLKAAVPTKAAVLFDVGANIGEYSEKLASNIPHAQIFAFEPNPASFRRLVDRFSIDRSITAVNVGLGAAPGELDLYDYSADGGSAHASLHADVMRSIHHCAAPKPIKVTIETLESVCRMNRIEHLHFLKIDTEGNELAVLEGGQNLVDQQRIDIIQFEFNEMNVISRAFLRDFYNILEQYTMFRLSEYGLIRLGNYDTRYEIFKFQNIIAARKEIAANWIPRFCVPR